MIYMIHRSIKDNRVYKSVFKQERVSIQFYMPSLFVSFGQYNVLLFSHCYAHIMLYSSLQPLHIMDEEEKLSFSSQFIRFAVFYGRSILCQSFVTFLAVASCFYYVIEVCSALYLSMIRDNYIHANLSYRISSSLCTALPFISAQIYVEENQGQGAIHNITKITESAFFAVFLVDYFLTIFSEPSKRDYIFSFQGLVDFLSLLPVLNLLDFGSGHIAILSFCCFVFRCFFVLPIFYLLR